MARKYVLFEMTIKGVLQHTKFDIRRK